MNDNAIPAGLLGNFYAARHAYGHYRSCALTCRYKYSSTSPSSSSSSSAQSRLTSLLKHALRRTISTHAGLCYGVSERSGDGGSFFVRQKSISWEAVTASSTSAACSEERQDEVLCDLLGHLHDEPWTDQWNRPAWKVHVLQHAELRVVDVVFVNHHAIGDGLSLKAFHRTLYKYLQEASALPSLPDAEAGTEGGGDGWPYIVPEDLIPPAFIEDRITLSPLPEEPLSLPSSTSALSPWTGNPPTLQTNKSRASITTLPPDHLTSVTQYLSSLSSLGQPTISLTSYLHSLILIHLSHTLSPSNPHRNTNPNPNPNPSPLSFRGETPFSLRTFAGTAPDEMVNHISCIDNDWPATLISWLLTSSWPEDEAEVLRKINAVYRGQLKAELDVTRASGPTFLREVKGIEDLEAYCEEAMKRERGHTYELSNLGAADMDSDVDMGVDMNAGVNAEKARELEVEKLAFTQCAMVTGPAFGCNVIAVQGAKMTVTFTWQEGIVEEELMVGCGRFIAREFERVHQKMNKKE